METRWAHAIEAFLASLSTTDLGHLVLLTAQEIERRGIDTADSAASIGNDVLRSARAQTERAAENFHAPELPLRVITGSRTSRAPVEPPSPSGL